MVYLKNFTILSREQEERILDSIDYISGCALS